METIIISKQNGLFDIRPLINYMASQHDGDFRIEVTRIRQSRSNRQNAWLWGCIYPILRQGMIAAGFDDITSDEDVHWYFKTLLNGKRIVNKDTGEIVTIPSSTAAMTTSEFSEYCEQLRHYGEEYLGVTIPDPVN